VHAPLCAASRGKGLERARVARTIKEKTRALGFIVGEKEGIKRVERFESQGRLGWISEDLGDNQVRARVLTFPLFM